MDKSKAIKILNTLPLVWPKQGFQFTFLDIKFEVKLDRSYKNEAYYAVYMMVYSKRYAKFLDKVGSAIHKLSSCPRLARVPGTSDIAVFGQASWEVLKPDWRGPVDAPAAIDEEIYRPGGRFVRLGYSHALEESLAQFILETTSILELHDGLLSGYMPDGFIHLSLGSFDAFYGFVYACHEAGKTAKECCSILPKSSVMDHYTESFNVNNATLADIQTLYSLFDTMH